MTLAIWPVELERPLRDSFNQQRGDNRRRQRGDQGPSRQRRGVSKSTEVITMTFIATADERARFWRFYIEEIGEGALPFIMADWGRDGIHLWNDDGTPLTDENDTPLLIDATWVCQFDQVPSETPSGVEWTIKFTLEVLP